MAVIERFVVLLYDRTSAVVEVNQARKELFSKKARSLIKIPTTRAALQQHAMPAVFLRSMHPGSSASKATRDSFALCMGMRKRWDLLETQVDDSSSSKGHLL